MLEYLSYEKFLIVNESRHLLADFLRQSVDLPKKLRYELESSLPNHVGLYGILQILQQWKIIVTKIFYQAESSHLMSTLELNHNTP